MLMHSNAGSLRRQSHAPDQRLVVQRVPVLCRERIDVSRAVLDAVQGDKVVVGKGEEEVVVRVRRVLDRRNGLDSSAATRLEPA
jgi:putative ribosome biogenesis GTPase RsgA